MGGLERTGIHAIFNNDNPHFKQISGNLNKAGCYSAICDLPDMDMITGDGSCRKIGELKIAGKVIFGDSKQFPHDSDFPKQFYFDPDTQIFAKVTQSEKGEINSKEPTLPQVITSPFEAYQYTKAFLQVHGYSLEEEDKR